MYHISHPLYGALQSLGLEKVCLEQFQLLEILSEGLADGPNLSLVPLISHGPSDLEAAVL